MYYFNILFVYIVNYLIGDFYFEIAISLRGSADFRGIFINEREGMMMQHSSEMRSFNSLALENI